MIVSGVDFSSAPKKSKPIVIAECRVGEQLELLRFIESFSMNSFEQWLNSFEGIAGIDAPFGFPQEFRDALKLHGSWEEQARQIEQLGLEEVFQIAHRFRAARPVGAKEPLRLADRVTQSVSSMKMFNPPIGRMAVKIIPLLAQCDASIYPVRTRDSSRTVFEIYCTPFARSVVGRTPYKNKQGLEPIRAKVLEALPILVNDEDRKRVLEDDLGDFLDALIGALEAHEAWKKIKAGLQILPEGLDPLEGWTVSSMS